MKSVADEADGGAGRLDYTLDIIRTKVREPLPEP
jgi:hypothetical protein